MTPRDIIILTYITVFKRFPTELEISERLKLWERRNEPFTLPVNA